MIRLIKLTTIGLLIVYFSSWGLMAKNLGSETEIFFDANQAYKNGRFQIAADGYLELIENGFDAGHVYYNLGNTYFRLGSLGKAILFYERARLLIPRDDDLAFNLSYAKEQVVDAVDEQQRISMLNISGLDSLNWQETFFIFTITNIFFFSILGIRLVKEADWSYYLFILSAIIFSICACVLFIKWYGTISDDRAVVLSEEALVRAGPDIKDTVLFKLHEGTVVHYERKEDNWALLNLSKDKRGWVESIHVEQIATIERKDKNAAPFSERRL